MTGRHEKAGKARVPALRSALAVLACVSIAACSSGPKVASVDKKYGVTASPRVVAANKKIPRGGGRRQVGKPYKIAGRWYHPKEDPNYSRVGQASWYGEAFHGRLTANGEIFDMNTLTAAHTTMPLPSYARVTNLSNGRSVIVRVNDRGPFAHDREIDLSKRTAEVLDFKHKGLAKVKVEYVGQARLDGQDQAFLLASIRGPGQKPATLFAGLHTVPTGPVPTPPTRPYLVDGNPFDPSVYTALASREPIERTRLASFDPYNADGVDEPLVRTAGLYYAAPARVSDAHQVMDEMVRETRAFQTSFCAQTSVQRFVKGETCQ
ncbi:septal ring lytic transglycosylase RlpA family protein [Coralliovum pocilloporae]|uniref:septal ring lytic transglycosylase RlpA family protein n=1 Tax=Coralliovum pocilloporae TaxID=3066369 RepID=UPI00330741C3